MKKTEIEYLTIVQEAICRIKTISKEDIQPQSFVGKDLGLDSIAIVDLWFELKKELRHPLDINSFFQLARSVKADPNRNDFTIQLVIKYLGEQIEN